MLVQIGALFLAIKLNLSILKKLSTIKELFKLFMYFMYFKTLKSVEV